MAGSTEPDEAAAHAPDPREAARGVLHVGAAVTLVVLDSSGGRQEIPVKLDRDGVGRRTVPFGRNQVDKVYVVLTNASTRSTCWNSDDTYACSGSPKDEQKKFTLDLAVVEKA